MLKLSLFMWTLAGSAALAAPIQFASSEKQTALIELYTSEGCSSCPPAEAWVSKLKNDPGLWTNFVPIAFHVAYWNHLGWRDVLSDEQFSARQQTYAERWSAENIYTPEFVLNGKEWHNWLGFRGAPTTSDLKPGRLQVTSTDGKHWQAKFTSLQKNQVDYEISVAVLISDSSTDVKAGENAGRRLQHDFAALSLVTLPLTRETNTGTFVVDTHTKGVSGRLALAVWVTRAGQLEPLQATGGWLPKLEEKNQIKTD
jgi:hypothetical protein